MEITQILEELDATKARSQPMCKITSFIIQLGLAMVSTDFVSTPSKPSIRPGFRDPLGSPQ
jgi:hypothetical protein